MRTLDWLMKGDPSIQRLVSKYLIDKSMVYDEAGILKGYLDLFDTTTGLWGGGVYGPKWISTHYTMLELKYMEIEPSHPFYQRGLLRLLDHEWRNEKEKTTRKNLDICVLGMVLGLAAYGESSDPRMNEIVDYLLEHQMEDGGWNCSWDYKRHPSVKSSLHTTLTVLEAFNDCIKKGYTYKNKEMLLMMEEGENFILKKSLFRSVHSGEVIRPEFMKFHYPTRWKYDAFRALEYFQEVYRPYDDRMRESLDIIIKQISKGYITKGPQYSGRMHFDLEEGRAGRFNTFRALKILKFYEPEFYTSFMEVEFNCFDT